MAKDKNFKAGRNYKIMLVSKKYENEGDFTKPPEVSSSMRPFVISGEQLLTTLNVKTTDEYLKLNPQNIQTDRTLFFWESDDDGLWHPFGQGNIVPVMYAPPQPAALADAGSAAPQPAPANVPSVFAAPQPYYGGQSGSQWREKYNMLEEELARRNNELQILRDDINKMRESQRTQIEENHRLRMEYAAAAEAKIMADGELHRQIEQLKGQAAVFNERLTAATENARKEAAFDKEMEIKQLKMEMEQLTKQLAEMQQQNTALSDELEGGGAMEKLAEVVSTGLNDENSIVSKGLGLLLGIGEQFLENRKQRNGAPAPPMAEQPAYPPGFVPMPPIKAAQPQIAAPQAASATPFEQSVASNDMLELMGLEGVVQ